MMPSPYEMVKAFHLATGLEVREPGDPIDFSFEADEVDDLMQLRDNLNCEEWKELQQAWENEDLVEYTDAVCDLVYVLLGSLVSFGVDFDACFAEVQRSNMSKLDENGQPIVRDDGKILKGPNFTPPDLRSIIYGKS